MNGTFFSFQRRMMKKSKGGNKNGMMTKPCPTAMMKKRKGGNKNGMMTKPCPTATPTGTPTGTPNGTPPPSHLLFSEYFELLEDFVVEFFIEKQVFFRQHEDFFRHNEDFLFSEDFIEIFATNFEFFTNEFKIFDDHFEVFKDNVEFYEKKQEQLTKRRKIRRWKAFKKGATAMRILPIHTVRIVAREAIIPIRRRRSLQVPAAQN